MKERPIQSEATTTPAPPPGEGGARRRLLFAMSLGRDPSQPFKHRMT